MAIAIPSFPRLDIETLAAFKTAEPEILKRISQTPRGGYLFVLSPLTLLHDLNVVLSDDVLVALVRATPNLASISDRAYQALKASARDPVAVVNVKGLFEVLHQ